MTKNQTCQKGASMFKTLVLLILSTFLGFGLVLAQEGQKEVSASDTTKPAPGRDTVKAKAAVPTDTAKTAKTAPKTAKNTVVVIETNQGTFEVELFMKESPITAKNFLDLVNKGFYNGLTFHRIVPGFVIQGGDPKGDGTGGHGYTIPDEKSIKKQYRGTLAMAREEQPNSAGSQFYVNLKDNLYLDNKGFCAFAQVVKGMEVVDKIGTLKNSGGRENRALEKVVMTKVYVKKGK